MTNPTYCRICKNDKENVDLMVKSKSGNTNKCKECWNQYQRDNRAKKKVGAHNIGAHNIGATQPVIKEISNTQIQDMEKVPTQCPSVVDTGPCQAQQQTKYHHQMTHSQVINPHSTVTREEFDILNTSFEEFKEFKKFMTSRLLIMESKIEQIEGNLNIDPKISIATSALTSRIMKLELRIEDVELIANTVTKQPVSERPATLQQTPTNGFSTFTNPTMNHITGQYNQFGQHQPMSPFGTSNSQFGPSQPTSANGQFNQYSTSQPTSAFVTNK